jgi:hypothetical protein
MGTNYYMYLKPACYACGHTPPENVLHIGKSSVGWAFALHAIPERGLNSFEDWLALWKSKGTELVIRNEYWDRIPLDEMVREISERAAPLQRAEWPHRVGAGATWDLITGDFS